MSQLSETPLDTEDFTPEDLQVADPVVFPLDDPPEDTQRSLRKIWARHQLTPYLRRWEEAYVPNFPNAIWAFDWRACDVGCGFGMFVLRESAHHPSRAYLGIEKGTRRGIGLAKRAQASGQNNLFAIHGNAIPLLAEIPDQSFDLITLFYPNPWWPTKHRKKRWAFHPLLPKLVSLLKPDATLLLAANERFYLCEWLYALRHHPDVAPFLVEDYVGPIQETVGRTHFETKYLEHGIACGEIRFKKKYDKRIDE
ncbi:hypothetical protein L6R29_17780 [Myxococcota bacterium]|nr:hypothetical protein [Myxococcota bacterium]